jgi:hypothetical protein
MESRSIEQLTAPALPRNLDCRARPKRVQSRAQRSRGAAAQRSGTQTDAPRADGAPRPSEAGRKRNGGRYWTRTSDPQLVDPIGRLARALTEA